MPKKYLGLQRYLTSVRSIMLFSVVIFCHLPSYWLNLSIDSSGRGPELFCDIYSTSFWAIVSWIYIVRNHPHNTFCYTSSLKLWEMVTSCLGIREKQTWCLGLREMKTYYLGVIKNGEPGRVFSKHTCTWPGHLGALLPYGALRASSFSLQLTTIIVMV